MQERIHIKETGKENFFREENKEEIKRLETQQRLLLNFDMPVYEKYLKGKKNLNVLDIGSNNGKTLMARLGNKKEVAKIVGLEFDPASVIKANLNYSNENIHFYEVDVESINFIDNLKSIMEELNIKSFDWINVLAVMSHIKDPQKLLRILREVCSEDAIIFIRNVDDGLNFVYPDDDLYFKRAFKMIDKCDTTGYRNSGRELFTLLKRAGYKDVVYEKVGINSSTMDHKEKEALFDTIFMFLKNSIKTTVKNNPNNEELLLDKEWLENNFDKLKKDFLADDSFVNFGFLIVVAKNNFVHTHSI